MWQGNFCLKNILKMTLNSCLNVHICNDLESFNKIQHQMPKLILVDREMHNTFFLCLMTKLFLKRLSLTCVCFSMRFTHHPLQRKSGRHQTREISCSPFIITIFAYCVTVHYFQISFRIKICKLVTTSCLTPSQPALVISARDPFSFVASVMCSAFIRVHHTF